MVLRGRGPSDGVPLPDQSSNSPAVKSFNDEWRRFLSLWHRYSLIRYGARVLLGQLTGRMSHFPTLTLFPGPEYKVQSQQGDQFRFGLGSPTMSLGLKDTTHRSCPPAWADRLAETRRWPSPLHSKTTYLPN
jgi:hypothetical protein